MWNDWTSGKLPASWSDDVARLQRDLDWLWGRVSGSPGRSRMPWGFPGAGVFPPVNIEDRGETLVVTAEVPGVRTEDLEIEVTQRNLTLRGRRPEELPEGVALHRRERPTGAFHRSITLPDEVQGERVEAACRDGVLRITLPKRPEAQPQRIKVSTR